MYNKKNQILKFTLALLLTLLMSIFMATSVLAAEGDNQISSITLNKSKTEIEIEVKLSKDYVKENKSSSVYLFELLPHHSTSDINSLTPVATLKVKNKTSCRISLENGNDNRLYSKFLLAEKLGDGSYSVLSSAKYIENIESLAGNKEAFPKGSSKKGLQIQMLTDAQLLGVQHTVINVAMNELMAGEGSDFTTPFEYGGQTFYINKKELSLLDLRVKTYTDAGINVYFNIILTKPTDTDHPNIKSLYYDGISQNAELYALNTRSESAMRQFRAFMDFICGRYTYKEHNHGFVPAIILGFEVNSGGKWNNAGSTDASAYVYSYCTAFRVAYTAMRSHYANGKVYISLSNNFNQSASAADGTAQTDYPAKDFLDTFNAAIKSSGNIEWGLSINPYPSSPNLVNYWSDALAEDNFETPYITMKNIGVITRYLSQDEFKYNKETRSVIIGEFGLSGNPSNETSLTIQAAAYAVAYYTAEQNEDIDAFIYHRHVDNASEGDCYGLWSNVNGTVIEPSIKKPIYEVFSLIDTAESENVTAFVRSAIGSGAFGTYMGDNIKYKPFNKRTVYPSVSAAQGDYKGCKSTILFDLTAGSPRGFYPSNDTTYVELRPYNNGAGTTLYSVIPEAPLSYKGISNTSFEGEPLKGKGYITLSVMAETPEGVSSVSLMLRLQSTGNAERDTIVYEGEALITPNEWQTVGFNIEDFAEHTEGDIDLLNIFIRSADSTTPSGNYGIWLENIQLYNAKGLPVIAVILIILLILAMLAVLGYAALYIRAQYIRKKRREAAAQRKREALRQQMMNQTRSGMSAPPYQARPDDERFDT